MNAPEPVVHEGRDGWLFLRGGSNFVARLYSRKTGNLRDERLALWRMLIETRTARCRKLGIDCLHVVVPEKVTIYGDMQGEPFVDPELSPAIRLREQMERSDAAGAYLDLVTPLREGRRSGQVYWREDSHWNAEGCLVAYNAICRHFGAAAETDLLERKSDAQERVLDLGAHMNPPRREYGRHYNFARKSQRTWTNNVTRYLEDEAYRAEFHVGARASYHNPTANDPRSVLIWGDSASRPDYNLLTGMLAETFRNVEFVWSSRVDWRHVRKRAPDIMIVELTERFLQALPRDNLNLSWWQFRVGLRAMRSRLKRRLNDRAPG